MPCHQGAKGERDALRQEMFGAGCTVEMVAREMSRRWRCRSREAYRHAHGWSQDAVARRFSEVASRIEEQHVIQARGGIGPRCSSTVMSGVRIGEYERWPSGGRRPSVYALIVLGKVFDASVNQLVDYFDHCALPDTDRAVLAAIQEADHRERTAMLGVPAGVPRSY